MRRSDQNPVLTRLDIPGHRPSLTDVSSVFNPGAAVIDGRIHLLLRVQNRGRQTLLLPATSHDGTRFEVASEPAVISGLKELGRTVYHVYDPRTTLVDGQLIVVLAVDTDGGCMTVVTRGDDLAHLTVVGTMHDGPARNGVVFPEKIGGRYAGLVRPNTTTTAGGPATGSEIWLVDSDDLARWRAVKPVMRGRPHYWDELIGSGPPPVKTRQGWLHVYHGVATHFASASVYQAGICLLDLEDPSIVVARGPYNVLEPREPYEQVGQVPNVVFPTGLIVDRYDTEGYALPDARTRVYYGAADTAVAMAESTVAELIASAREGDT